jgi:hypothetical protein
VQIPNEYLEDDKWQQVEGLTLYNPRLVDSRIARQKGLFTIQDKAVEEIVRTPELITHSIPSELKQGSSRNPLHDGNRQEQSLS